MGTFVRMTLGPTATALKENDSDFKRVIAYITSMPPLKDIYDLDRYKYILSNKFVWFIKCLAEHYEDGTIDDKEEVILYIKGNYFTMNSKSIKTIVKECTNETIALYFITYLSGIVNGSIWVPKGHNSLTTYFGTLTIS